MERNVEGKNLQNFSYIVMLISPLLFIALYLLAVVLVAIGGHSSGDIGYELSLLAIFSIVYSWLIQKKKNHKVNGFTNASLILLTLLILSTSAYFLTMTMLFPTGYSIDYFIVVLMGVLCISSITVIIDCFRFYVKKDKSFQK